MESSPRLQTRCATQRSSSLLLNRVLPFVMLAGVMTVAQAVVASIALAREPTEYEQYMIELTNRARLDPGAEVVRLGTGDLNEGPPSLGPYPYTIPAGAKQPLAVSMEIVDAASDYAQSLNDLDEFCHTCLGTDSPQRMWMAGYVPLLSDFDFFDIAGYTLAYGGAQDPLCTSGCLTYVPGRENLSLRREGPSDGMIDDLVGAIDLSHSGLFNDFNTSSRGHRSSMLYGEWKEVGIGIIEGIDSGGLFDSVYIVQNFAHRSDTGAFLTGVAYIDVDEDGFYTPNAGEALGGIAITVFEAGTSTLVGSTSTMMAGGYRIELPIGNYDIQAAGSNVAATYFDIAILGSGPNGIGENTKLDIVPEPSLSLGLAFGILSLSARARRQTGALRHRRAQ